MLFFIILHLAQPALHTMEPNYRVLDLGRGGLRSKWTDFESCSGCVELKMAKRLPAGHGLVSIARSAVPNTRQQESRRWNFTG